MIPELGLIEGFFGRPWSWADREAAVRFLEPIEPGLPRPEIEARVHAAINELEP